MLRVAHQIGRVLLVYMTFKTVSLCWRVQIITAIMLIEYTLDLDGHVREFVAWIQNGCF